MFNELVKETTKELEAKETRGRARSGNAQDNFEYAVKFILAKDGEVPSASGLNWGHSTAPKNKNKPHEPRERNDAYLSIKADARKEGFLPDQGFTFTMNADDGFVMDCVVAQEGRKGVQTTDGNPILGEYIRKRIGVPSGKFVTTSDLIRYGRTDFTLTKLDDETFEIDLSVNKNNQVS